MATGYPWFDVVVRKPLQISVLMPLILKCYKWKTRHNAKPTCYRISYNLFQMTMNDLKKVLRSATDGDEDALAFLKLDNVQPINFTKVKEITINNINLAYQTVAKVRSAAKLLCRHSIIQTAQFLMEALHFMQESNFQQPVRYNLSKEDVLQSLRTQVKDIRAFCVDCGEEEEGSFYVRNLDCVRNLEAGKVQDASNGDEEALSVIGLEEMPSLKISRWKKTPGYLDLGSSFGAAGEMAMAGRYISDKSLETVSTLTLSFLDVFQQKYQSKEKPHKFDIDGAGISNTVLSEVAEIKQCLEEISVIRIREKKEEDPEDSVAEEKDPSYSPLKDDSSGSSVISPSDSEEPQKSLLDLRKGKHCLDLRKKKHCLHLTIYPRKNRKNLTRTKQRRTWCRKVIQDHTTPHENAPCVRRNNKIYRGIYVYTSNGMRLVRKTLASHSVWQQNVSGKEHPPRREDCLSGAQRKIVRQ